MMHRFYLPPGDCTGNSLTLSGREAHHAAQVVRVRRGDHVMVLNGAGVQFDCEVRDSRRDEVQLAIIDKRTIPAPPCPITLLQAVPKGKIIEDIIQKATELGAARIVPLLTERVAMHVEAAGAAEKAAKWQQVAVEAIKQCGAAWLPKVEAPQTPRTYLVRNENFEFPLIASLQPGSRPAREYFDGFQKKHHRHPASACIWIGPEGDFTPEEVALIQSAGALPITLGRLVLRVETAAIYCLSVLNYELQTMPLR